MTPMPTGKMVDRDNGYRALMKRVVDRGAPAVTVGIHEGEGAETTEDGSATVVEVAEFHEFGLGVPRRSVLADWFDENENQNRENLKKIGQAVIQGKVASIEQGLDRFGLRARGEIQQRIRAGIDPPLDEATIVRKGSDTPLIDTGQLWGSITHQIEKG